MHAPPALRGQSTLAPAPPVLVLVAHLQCRHPPPRSQRGSFDFFPGVPFERYVEGCSLYFAKTAPGAQCHVSWPVGYVAAGAEAAAPPRPDYKALQSLDA